MSMKNSNGIIGNRTRELSACSAKHQSTSPPRTPALQVEASIPLLSRFLISEHLFLILLTVNRHIIS